MRLYLALTVGLIVSIAGPFLYSAEQPISLDQVAANYHGYYINGHESELERLLVATRSDQGLLAACLGVLENLLITRAHNELLVTSTNIQLKNGRSMPFNRYLNFLLDIIAPDTNGFTRSDFFGSNNTVPELFAYVIVRLIVAKSDARNLTTIRGQVKMYLSFLPPEIRPIFDEKMRSAFNNLIRAEYREFSEAIGSEMNLLVPERQQLSMLSNSPSLTRRLNAGVISLLTAQLSGLSV